MSKKKERTFYPIAPVAVSMEIPINGNLTLLEGDEVTFHFHGAAVNNGHILGFVLQAIGFSFRRDGNDIVVRAMVREETRTFSPAGFGVDKMESPSSPSCSDDWR